MAITSGAERPARAVTAVDGSTGRQPTVATADESELLLKLRAGDEEAFAAVVDRHHAAMVRLARSYVRTDAVAEEVAQDAWLALLRGLDGFEGRSSLRTWLLRVVANRARSTGLREGRYVSVEDARLEASDGRFSQDGWWVTPPTHWADDIVERLTAPVLAALARAHIETLPAAQRQVVTLRDVEGLSSVEASTILGITTGYQRVLLHRARASIRRRLEEEVTA